VLLMFWCEDLKVEERHGVSKSELTTSHRAYRLSSEIYGAAPPEAIFVVTRVTDSFSRGVQF